MRHGLSWREALSLGALMNTRGLLELVVLNAGLDVRVASPSPFAMRVLTGADGAGHDGHGDSPASPNGAEVTLAS
jgi:Kef-type K+ transport system membrane component KefB